jgi:YD repeat-containing protein
MKHFGNPQDDERVTLDLPEGWTAEPNEAGTQIRLTWDALGRPQGHRATMKRLAREMIQCAMGLLEQLP